MLTEINPDQVVASRPRSNKARRLQVGAAGHAEGAHGAQQVLAEQFFGLLRVAALQGLGDVGVLAADAGARGVGAGGRGDPHLPVS